MRGSGGPSCSERDGFRVLVAHVCAPCAARISAPVLSVGWGRDSRTVNGPTSAARSQLSRHALQSPWLGLDLPLRHPLSALGPVRASVADRWRSEVEAEQRQLSELTNRGLSCS